MNPHLQHAIRLYEQRGEQFANLIPWHTVHGVVRIDVDGVLLCHYADSRDLLRVVDRATADTLFISYFGGDPSKFAAIVTTEFIAYERLRNRGAYRIRPTEAFLKKLIN